MSKRGTKAFDDAFCALFHNDSPEDLVEAVTSRKKRKPTLTDLLEQDGIVFSAQKAARAPLGPLDAYVRDGKLTTKQG